ncbi:MAG TPA: ATP-binding protein [Anaeromyxobacteraceae bacterium]|nr:ATP-binding protein [Anaeromyxobacteraceae bacterium]
MDIRTQASLLCAIVTLALAGAALLRQSRPRVFTLFAVFSLDLCAFSLAQFLQRWTRTPAGFDVWERVAVVAGSLTPTAALAFFLEFLGVARRPARRARNAMLGGSLLGFAVAMSPLVHLSLAKLAVTFYVVAGMAVVLSVLWGKLHAAPTRVESARLLYLFIGACIAVVLSTLDQLPRFGVPYPLQGLGAVVLTLFMFFLSQTLQRHRLLDLHEFLGKIVVVSSLGLVLVAIYGGLVSWVGNRTELFYFNTLVASFVILSLFEPLREKVEEWVVATLFRERYELVRRLEALRDRIGNVIDPSQLATALLDGLVETRRVTHASLWLLAEDRPGYRLLDSRGPPPASFLEAATARALLGAASSGQKALLLENIDRRLAELRAHLPPGPDEAAAAIAAPVAVAEELRRLGDARAAMSTMKAGICMPLTAGDRVVGFLACMDERVQEAFASNEIAALLEVADRSALVIENSKLYQAMKERDRLAALGEMAAGLAHEIRNPLAAIKGAIQFILPEPPRAGPELDAHAEQLVPREFLTIIVEEVNRLNGVVTQFLDYSRPAKSALSPSHVNRILERTFELLARDLPANLRLTLELAPDLPRVLCDAEQLKQVFLNLALNAVQAMPDGGALTVSTRLARDEAAVWREAAGPVAAVEIRFRDDGPGVPEEARENIFVPFYTTKEKGTGLGLAISQRIVKGHQGTIGVRQAPGGGAEFVLSFPALREDLPELPPEPAAPARPARAGSRIRRRRRRRPA